MWRDVNIKVPLRGKEGEALLWGLSIIGDLPERDIEGPRDPLGVLLREGFSRREIAQRCEALTEFAYGDCIVGPLMEIDRSILRVCIENTTWLEPYKEFYPEMLSTTKGTLRSFAAQLETLGIEVSHIPDVKAPNNKSG